MLVNEEFRKCVTFLYKDVQTPTGSERWPVGSAFFVVVEVISDRWAVYVITARHVVDGSGLLLLRMPMKDGRFTDLPVDPDAWEQSLQTDVAVARLPASDAFDFIHIRLQELADEAFVQQHGVGEGDDVFFSGLFIGHYGQGAPQPIIRFGNIALMPREPVNVEISKNPTTFRNIEAYLVEARSWGGQSGSPAFVTFPPDRHMGGGLVIGGGPPFALLGLVQGIWKDPKGAKAPDPSGEGVVEVNMGISVVVPAYRVKDVLMSEKLAQERANAAAQLTAGSLQPPVATSSEPTSEFTQFEDLTRNLVNVPKREVDEKRSAEET